MSGGCSTNATSAAAAPKPRLRRLAIWLGLIVAGLLFWSSAAPASAVVVWNLDIHHNETNFPPGGTAEYWFDVSNVGDSPSVGAVSLNIKLPPGVTRALIRNADFSGSAWSCPGVSGTSTFTCTTGGPVPRHTVNRALIVKVNVAPGASGDVFASATLSGGGAASVVDAELTRIDPEPAGFGIVPGSFEADFFEGNGITTVRQAGAHPDLATFAFDFNTVSDPLDGEPDQKAEAEAVRNLRVALPEGFVGDPTAVGQCTPAELTVDRCPPSSQVGRVDLAAYPLGKDFTALSRGVFNMAAPKGVIADLAFVYAGAPIHVEASLDPSTNYAVRTTVSNVTEALPPFHQKLTIWGTPADPTHDSERCESFDNVIDTSAECPSPLPEEPFLTTPSDCEADNVITLSKYDSWQNTGVFGPDIPYELRGRFTGCENVPFEPSIELTPTNTKADTPTGLDVTVAVEQNSDPDGIAASPLKEAVVTLPEGMTTNPSTADGLGACSEAQIALGTDDEVECPSNAKIGTAELITPVLPDPVSGSVYLAEQGNKGPEQGSNPFDSMLAMYLVLEDEDLGLLVKLPGKITTDPETGQLTTTFSDNPQLPFSELNLSLKDGSRAPLVNPPTCGTKTVEAEMSPWARPTEIATASDTFEITQPAGGGPCPAAVEERPFDPTLTAGVPDPTAAGSSPFVLKLTRTDGTQEFKTLDVATPEGLTAVLKSASQCPEAEIAANACPESSKVGSSTVGTGAGTNPFFVEGGSVYLAGPYDPDGAGSEPEAPLSLDIQVPAIAGPFDLGIVNVRAAIYVDPRTAQITVASDPIPFILEGIPLHVRDIRVAINRPGFMVSPTDCGQKQVASSVTAYSGATATPSSPFAVSNCAALDFAPRLDLSYPGGKKQTKRNAHPPLKAKLQIDHPAGSFDPDTPDAGASQANIASVQVTLPKGTLLDQNSPAFTDVCTRPQYAAASCPAVSQIGTAKAFSPLLAEPLEGPVYLKTSDNQLPDLAADLDGIVEIDLFGRIDQSDSRIRNTFDIVPDVPVSSFKLKLNGGKAGVLANSKTICKSKTLQRVRVTMIAQNDSRISQNQLIKSGCSNGKKKSGGPK